MRVLESVDNIIVKRGFEYYKQHLVYSGTTNDHIKLKGKVRDYLVEFNVSDFEKSTCTCEYAKKHSVCKHMIALYFYIFRDKAHEYEFEIGGERYKDIAKRLLQCETLDSLFRSGHTKTDIKAVYRLLGTKELVKHRWKLYQCRIERTLIDVAKNYNYKRDAVIGDFEKTFDYVVYDDGVPVLAIEYLNADYLTIDEKPVDVEKYNLAMSKLLEKKKFCESVEVPLLEVDFLELSSHCFGANEVRSALRNKDYANKHNENRRKDYLNEFIWDCTDENYEAIHLSKLCGCINCGEVYPSSAVKIYDQTESAHCPKCKEPKVICDYQGFEITPEFMIKVKALYENVDQEWIW